LIAPEAHFVWMGRRFPWVYYLGVVSAARRGGFERVHFHHTDDLTGDPSHEALAGEPGVARMRLAPEPVIEAAGGPKLVDVYRELATPAARVNLIRMALLHERGGVYLDTDTITLQSFGRLLALGGVFCGEERLVYPGSAGTGILSRLRPGALARTAVRDVLRRLPRGHRYFRRIERHYPTAVNNAVLGAEARHPFLRALIDLGLSLPRDRRGVRYAFGTHLLQAAVAEWRGPGLNVQPPPAFYPLGPEISEHWFRPAHGVTLGEVLGADTVLVHWYASVRTAAHTQVIDRAWLRAHEHDRLFAALALRALDPEIDALAHDGA
jgi:hypothetical protein